MFSLSVLIGRGFVLYFLLLYLAYLFIQFLGYFPLSPLFYLIIPFFIYSFAALLCGFCYVKLENDYFKKIIFSLDFCFNV